jgi:hypothetical protein
VQKEKDKFLEKLHAYLFAGKEEQIEEFNADQQAVVLRYRAIFSKWLAEPMLSDVMMKNYIANTFEVCDNTAWKDVSRIKIIIGNVQNASKEFQRYRATEMILAGYEMASDAHSQLEVKQAQIMIKAGETLGRIYMLDKNEIDRIPWEDIIPMELEPTTDISVIGRKPMKNLEEVKQRLRKKYGSPVDVPYEEIEDDGEEEGLVQ